MAAAAEAVNAAEGDAALEGEALETYVEGFDEGDLEAALTAAEDDVATAELAVEGAEGDLAASRGESFDDDGSAEAVLDAETAANTGFDTAVDSNGETLADAEIDLGLALENRQTDANIEKALTAAQSAVNADQAIYYVTDAGDAAETASYDDADSQFEDNTDAALADDELFTAKALQTAAINAESALNADVSANGSSADLLTEMRVAIADLVEAGVGLDEAVTGLDATDSNDAELGALLDEVNTLLGGINNAADATALQNAQQDASDFIESFIDADGDAVVTAELDTDNAGLDKTFNDLIADFEQRAELTVESNNADAVFESTLSGTILAAAETLQTERDNEKADVETAEEDLTEAQDLVSTLETLQGDYDTAVEELETAQQYFEDEGLELPVAVEGGVTATAENDIFLFTEEAGTVSGFGLEGDDQLFVGTDFTWTALEAADDLATDRLGDSSVLEIFAQQNGNNVVLSFENEAFAGNATNLEDITEVTLTGVSVEDLSLSADGFITVA